jgi:hypothetical protein
MTPIAGEHERAARLLEAWCEEAFEGPDMFCL